MTTRSTVDARRLYFTAPRTVEIRSRSVPRPGPESVRVRTLVSAISAGTEGLIYRGEAPRRFRPTKRSRRSTATSPFRCRTATPPSARWSRSVRTSPTAGSDDASSPTTDTRAPFSPTRGSAGRPGGCHARGCAVRDPRDGGHLLLDGAPLLGERVVVVGQGRRPVDGGVARGDALETLLTVEPARSAGASPRRSVPIGRSTRAAVISESDSRRSPATAFAPISRTNSPGIRTRSTTQSLSPGSTCARRLLVRDETGDGRPGRTFSPRPNRDQEYAGEHDRSPTLGTMVPRTAPSDHLGLAPSTRPRVALHPRRAVRGRRRGVRTARGTPR